MATGHMLTNRGKLLLLQGAWDDDTSALIRMGLLKVQGAAADTAVEVADLNTVNDLIVVSSCTECDFTNYGGRRCEQQHDRRRVLLRRHHGHERHDAPTDLGRLVRGLDHHERRRLHVRHRRPLPGKLNKEI
jgi:hypothetical protein